MIDPAEAPENLPPQVYSFPIACILDVGPQDMYASFDNPFGTLQILALSFQRDGWTIQEQLDDGTNILIDLTTLPSRADEVDPSV